MMPHDEWHREKDSITIIACLMLRSAGGHPNRFQLEMHEDWEYLSMVTCHLKTGCLVAVFSCVEGGIRTIHLSHLSAPFKSPFFTTKETNLPENSCVG
jgi:hypothetical protein